MTLPLGQRTLRERSALRSLVDWSTESKGFRHGLCEKPLTVRSWGSAETVTAALQCHRTAIHRLRRDAPLQGDEALLLVDRHLGHRNGRIGQVAAVPRGV